MKRIMNHKQSLRSKDLELRIKGLGVGICCALFIILMVLFSTPALAQTVSTSSAKNQTAQEKRITNIKDKADQEISRRLNALNQLVTRIQAMKKITDTSKTLLISQAQDQITNLNALKLKIDTDNDLNTLKTDTKSITTQYRIYMLFIPKTHILVASDKMLEIVDDINQIVPKLQSRIDAAGQEGKNIVPAQTALTDVQAKLIDIKVQVKKAQDEVMPLTPDQDIQSQITSNKNALQSALKSLQTARQDLRAVVKDIQIIKQNLNATPSAAPEE